MTEQEFARLGRLASAALELVREPGDHVAVTLFSLRVEQAAQRYRAAQEAILSLQQSGTPPPLGQADVAWDEPERTPTPSSVGAEGEGRAAAGADDREAAGELPPPLESLSRDYDVIRAAIVANAPDNWLPPVAASLEQTADLLAAAERVEEVLVSAVERQQQWARQLLPMFSPLVQRAALFWGERLVSQGGLEQVYAERRDAAALLQSVLTDLRRLVRTLWGEQSEQYQALRTIGGAR